MKACWSKTLSFHQRAEQSCRPAWGRLGEVWTEKRGHFVLWRSLDSFRRCLELGGLWVAASPWETSVPPHPPLIETAVRSKGSTMSMPTNLVCCSCLSDSLKQSDHSVNITVNCTEGMLKQDSLFSPTRAEQDLWFATVCQEMPAHLKASPKLLPLHCSHPPVGRVDMPPEGKSLS